MAENLYHKEIEKKWQELWEKQNIYHASDNSKKPKKYVLIEFPYPSGEGLHMGHLRPFLAGDIYSRFKRMQGHETLYPIGWDAFGLPAENFAIKNKLHPAVSTAKNIANAKRQLKSWGVGFDWDREVTTSDPSYYKWTQWIFLQLFKAGLAYEATGLINWCPKDKTGLANEEVIDGCCERCGTPVEKKEMKQWYLKITAYAEKLLEGLKNLKDWPERVRVQQENWIGKKEGINIEYSLEQKGQKNCLVIYGISGNAQENWFPWLRKTLEKQDWKVSVSNLPNSDHPVVDEWNEVLIRDFKPDSVIVGHSMGAPAALNLVQTVDKKVDKLILVAPVNPNQDWQNLKKNYPYDWGAVKNFADIKFDWKKIENLANQIVIYYSDNDPYVPAVSVENFYKQSLPSATYIKIAGQGHFGMKEFPKILDDIKPTITCFTTRPDTNFGATFVVIGPEHPLLKNQNILSIDKKNWKEIEKYKQKVFSEKEVERTAENRKKTGVFTGLYCINNLNGYKMPLYVADYVLGNVGTGAVVGVPGHDKRDFEFAQIFNIEIKRVVQKNKNDNGPIDEIDKVQEDEGTMVNSDFINGMDIHEATVKIMDYMEEKGYGKRVVNYKLRDWVFSRQRYWGEPIPIIHCGNCGTVAVPEDQLPVTLPEVKNYEPTGTGESPLAAIDSWVNVKCPNCDGPAKRETNTMPQWAGSSWYWLRYTDPKNTKELADKKLLKRWTPVDVYFGGMEHTTLHLLYSRFWNLFLYDQGIVTTAEPYTKRVPHGIILGPDGEKMSKSRGNVVNPDDIVEKFGADTLRMFEPFLGPHEATVPWNDKGVIGVKRFLDKVGRFTAHPELDSGSNPIHKLIKKITSDIENYKFNTAIAAFMEFLNENKQMSKENWETFVKLLAPFAPHITEEIWHGLGHEDSIHLQAWPKYDEKLAKDETVTVVVQILGKVRASLEIPAGISQDQVKEAALDNPNVKKYLEGKQIIKEVFVKDKLINFVIK